MAASRINHWASSVDIKGLKVIVYIYSSTWRLVTSIPGQPAPPPYPTMTLPGLASTRTWISLKAKTGGSEAGPGLRGADVAFKLHSCPMDGEEPATWKVAGSCAADTLPWQTYWACTGYSDRRARAPAGTSPAARLSEPVMVSRISLWPSVKLTWTYASQTGGLVHAKADTKNCLN